MFERTAKAPGLDAHNRVVLRVEGLVPSEDLHRDRECLDPIGTAGQGLLDDIAQEAPRPVGGGEVRTRHDLLDRRADSVRRRGRGLRSLREGRFLVQWHAHATVSPFGHYPPAQGPGMGGLLQ